MNNLGTINLNRHEPALDGVHLDDLIQRWLDDCAARLEPYTVAGYADKIEHFRRWWQSTGPPLQWQLHKRDLIHFARYLETLPLSYNSRKDVLRRLRAMFRWAHQEGYTESRDYTTWVPTAQGSAPLRLAAGLETLRRLMNATGISANPARNAAIVAILIGAGIRRAECAGLNVQDIHLSDDDSGVAIIRQAKRVRGREVHERPVAFDSATGRHVRLWLEIYDTPAGPLFPSAHGGRLTAQGVYKVVKEVIRLAGVEQEIQGPHDLRRAFATWFARERRGKGDEHLLSKQLGHANYRMTSQYSLQDVEDIKEVIVSPLSILSRNGYIT